MYRALRKDFGPYGRPIEHTISDVVRKFEFTGSVADIFKPTHYRIARSLENIVVVAESLDEDPTTSINRRSQQLGQSYGSLWRILHLDLHLHPYKVKLAQKLELNDHAIRRAYAE